MDLYIEKTYENVKLSDLGIYCKDIADSSPSVEVDKRSVTGRSGFVFANSNYGRKVVQVSASMTADTLSDFEARKSRLYGLLADTTPYYITKCMPADDSLYGFELPGRRTGDIDLLKQKTEPLNYRWKVTLSEGPDFSFLGRTEAGLRYELSFSFETAELPFGESKARTSGVLHSIPYQGTAPNSMLESPWELRLTSSATQKGFYVQVGRRKWEYTSTASIKADDVIRISGVGSSLNYMNINDRTNYEYFILEPGTTNAIKTNFAGRLEVVGLKDLYK